jgi:putative chitinase
MSVTGSTRSNAANVLPFALQTLHHIMRHASWNYLDPLNRAMLRYNISTAKRAAGFLAQLAVESHELRHVHELWTSRKDFELPGARRAAHTATSQRDYFNYWYGNRKDLGNVNADDGYNYRGRGAIQITGRANYKWIGAAIGKPLETHPDLLVTDFDVDMLASAYFFAELKHCNHIADGVDPKNPTSIIHVNRRLTMAVNGGHNGEPERLEYFKKGLKALGA